MATGVKSTPPPRQWKPVTSKDFTPVTRESRVKTGAAIMKTMGKWTTMGWGWRRRSGTRCTIRCQNSRAPEILAAGASAGGLDFGFDFLEDAAMHQQQFIGLRGAEDAFGPLAVAAFDGLFDIGK